MFPLSGTGTVLQPIGLTVRTAALEDSIPCKPISATNCDAPTAATQKWSDRTVGKVESSEQLETTSMFPLSGTCTVLQPIGLTVRTVALEDSIPCKPISATNCDAHTVTAQKWSDHTVGKAESSGHWKPLPCFRFLARVPSYSQSS